MVMNVYDAQTGVPHATIGHCANLVYQIAGETYVSITVLDVEIYAMRLMVVTQVAYPVIIEKQLRADLSACLAQKVVKHVKLQQCVRHAQQICGELSVSIIVLGVAANVMPYRAVKLDVYRATIGQLYQLDISVLNALTSVRAVRLSPLASNAKLGIFPMMKAHAQNAQTIALKVIAMKQMDAALWIVLVLLEDFGATKSVRMVV